MNLRFAEAIAEDESTVQLPAYESDEHDIAERPWHTKGSVRAFYLQLRSIYLANNLKKLAEDRGGFRYDWVFRLRFDNLYHGYSLEDIRLLDPNHVYIPKHDNWYGYNDRFAFGGTAAMDIYADRYKYLVEYRESGLPMHPERFLRWVLDRHCVSVRRTRVSAHLLRYGVLWKARYWPSAGDLAPQSYTTLERLYSRLTLTRFSSLVNKLYLAKARYLG